MLSWAATCVPTPNIEDKVRICMIFDKFFKSLNSNLLKTRLFPIPRSQVDCGVSVSQSRLNEQVTNCEPSSFANFTLLMVGSDHLVGQACPKKTTDL